MVAASPRKKTTSVAPFGLELYAGLQGAAGIETGADPLESGAAIGKRGRIIETTVTTKKLSAVAGPLDLPAVQVGECHAIPIICVEEVPREHRAGIRIDLRSRRRARMLRAGAEHPFDIGGDRETSQTSGDDCVIFRREILIESSSGT